jgi:hypothetical protein
MKVKHWFLVAFIISFFVLSAVCQGQNAELPDGLKILNEKMEKQEIPPVDFSKFKFEFPDKMPDEANIVKGYLWSGQHAHPVRRGGQGGAVTYLFLINFNKETGEMKFFRAWEKAAKIAYGWKILAGTFDPENKKKIDLQGKDESAFTIVINDKDHLTLS